VASSTGAVVQALADAKPDAIFCSLFAAGSKVVYFAGYKHLGDRYRIIAIGSINSPMQCMMKEICAQCLQPHVDPQTGKTTYFFSCFNQDQPLDQVDFGALAQRLAQNGVQEKLNALWIDRCLKQLPPPAERKAA